MPDRDTWWRYHNENIILSREFVPLDPEGKILGKGEFLKTLTSGKYIAEKVEGEDSLTYRLIELGEKADESISSSIKVASAGDYANYLLEGQEFPVFEFKDLEGNTYDNANTKGKTLVLKAWFINCKPCVAEMPDLNRLVEDYKEREDVIFVSLATDKPEELKKFLSETEFKYPVVAEQEGFLRDSLAVRAYPTHIIIDESGVISKVVNSYEELVFALERKEILPEKGEMTPPPPPPPPMG